MFTLGIGGIYLGVYLSRLAEGPAERWGLAFAMVGALLGLVLTPYLTTRPVRAIRKRMAQVSAQTMVAGLAGLIAGLLIAALVSGPISALPAPFGRWLPFFGALFMGYLGATIFIMRENGINNLIRSRFQSNPDGNSPAPQEGRSILMDTSVIIDGRIADIARTGFVQGPMLVPAFVLIELQHIADSADPLRRRRGRRGLDILNRLQKDNTIPLRITDLDVEGVREVDDKLVILGKQLKSPILTNDYNLNRVAELQGVTVLNINELANAVKAVYLPGETMDVQVIQEGKEVGQGVAYLDDGTMVVIEDGKENINTTIPVTVTKVLQTAAGRMIFAKPDAG